MSTRLRRLPRAFFARDTCLVARELLGKLLVRVLPDGARLTSRIVEVEAYLPDDAASHGYRGMTTRNAPMFGTPGLAYVYLIYGMHHCVNVSTEAKGIGAAVLIRALEPVEGIEVMQQHRQTRRVSETLRVFELCRGPGNVCKALGIDRGLSGVDMTRRDSQLFIADDGTVPDAISNSARIGVGGDVTAKTVPWRFYIAGNECVSGPKAMRS